MMETDRIGFLQDVPPGGSDRVLIGVTNFITGQETGPLSTVAADQAVFAYVPAVVV